MTATSQGSGDFFVFIPFDEMIHAVLSNRVTLKKEINTQ